MCLLPLEPFEPELELGPESERLTSQSTAKKRRFRRRERRTKENPASSHKAVKDAVDCASNNERDSQIHGLSTRTTRLGHPYMTLPAMGANAPVFGLRLYGSEVVCQARPDVVRRV